jgi:hypothetical protein
MVHIHLSKYASNLNMKIVVVDIVWIHYCIVWIYQQGFTPVTSYWASNFEQKMLTLINLGTNDLNIVTFFFAKCSEHSPICHLFELILVIHANTSNGTNHIV